MDRFDEAPQVATEFGLGRPLEVMRVAQGNSPTYRLRTDQGIFFIKSAKGQPAEWAELYPVVERVLNAQGVRQARLLLTLQGESISRQGYSAFEWLPGEAVRTPDKRQFKAHVQYLARYNRALGKVPLEARQISRLIRPDDLWRKAASLAYMLDEFRLDAAALGLREKVAGIARRTLELLRQWRPALQSLPCQLIHSDVGPGNILFEDDRVVSIIDFTPGHEPHLYALCISLFWHCVFDQPDAGARSLIAAAARLYGRDKDVAAEERRCFFPLMLRAAGYRLFARLIARDEAGMPHECAPFSPGSTERMAGCVERVLAWEAFLSSCFGSGVTVSARQ